jgi:hypothetical protein
LYFTNEALRHAIVWAVVAILSLATSCNEPEKRSFEGGMEDFSTGVVQAYMNLQQAIYYHGKANVIAN